MCLAEFTDHQRNVFCVFSGQGVSNLRRHLNTDSAFAHLRDGTPTGFPRHAQVAANYAHYAHPGHAHPDAGFDEQEGDVVDDDDGLDDGTEMVIDAAPLVGPTAGVAGASLDASIIPPPPPAPSQVPSMMWQPHNQHNQHWAPGVSQANGTLPAAAPGGQQAPGFQSPDVTDAMDMSPARPSASTAPLRLDGLTGAAHLRDQMDGSENGGGSSRSSPAP